MSADLARTLVSKVFSLLFFFFKSHIDRHNDEISEASRGFRVGGLQDGTGSSHVKMKFDMNQKKSAI
jgi:hypothetical protein